MTSQAVADLCWAVNSPSLASDPNIAIVELISPSDVDEEHLLSVLAAAPAIHRVGRYFEALIGYWLRHVRGVEVVDAGLQLRRGNITVGELDFLFRDEADVLVHCETAVKFFICLPGHEPSEFPGPNANDNFENKVSKLFDAQLAKSEEFIEGVGSRQGLMRGIIFFRSGELSPRPVARLSENHLRGEWLHVRDLDSLEGDQFAITTKPHWLAPPTTPDSLSRDDFKATIRTHFSEAGRPVMASSRGTNDAGETIEKQRLLIVSDGWPSG